MTEQEIIELMSWNNDYFIFNSNNECNLSYSDKKIESLDIEIFNSLLSKNLIHETWDCIYKLNNNHLYDKVLNILRENKDVYIFKNEFVCQLRHKGTKDLDKTIFKKLLLSKEIEETYVNIYQLF